MRIIGGLCKKKKLITPQDETIRPTTDRIKEAVFNAIQFQIQKKVFLDLFAGSGQMGLEALSRGAAGAIFIDQNPRAIATIRSNLYISGFKNNFQITRTDAFSFLKTKGLCFDIAYLDPPYHQNIINRVFPLVSQAISPNGIIICESSKKDQLPTQTNGFFSQKTYHYGQIVINIYTKSQ
jgi:16S rRNA (guanine(966)-N(2))-methyltransferase RsmD